MRYKVGAEQLQQVPSLAHRPDRIFRVARTAPVGPTHAVCAQTGAAVCGIDVERLEVLDEDWETACFVEKCPGCFAAVAACNLRTAGCYLGLGSWRVAGHRLRRNVREAATVP
jgi:hypothetical protein